MKLPEQVAAYKKYCELRNEAKSTRLIDLSSEDFIYPTELLPLGSFLKQNKEKIEISYPEKVEVSTYLDVMLNPSKRRAIEKSTYIPFVELDNQDAKKGEQVLGKLHPDKGPYTCFGGRNTYELLVAEITDNIYEHSKFNNSCLMAQKYKKLKFIEITALDDGITIAGSYNNVLNTKFTGIEGIQEALRGRSTKDAVERGFGLWTILRTVIELMKGSVLIVSGDGGFYKGKDFSDGVFLDLKEESHEFNGTLISLRYPIQKREIEYGEIFK